MIQRPAGPADSAGKPGGPKKPDGARRPPGTRAPIPSEMAKAAREIRGWVAAEKKPVREYERIIAVNPDGWEHNYRVSYVVNYELKRVGAVPGRHYTHAERAALSEKALWAPGLGRGNPGMPHSRTGGEPWYDRGHDRSARTDTQAPFILEVPRPAPTPEDSAGHLAQPPGHVDFGYGESVNLQTGRYSPGIGPEYGACRARGREGGRAVRAGASWVAWGMPRGGV
jgi:hypothetical protein